MEPSFSTEVLAWLEGLKQVVGAVLALVVFGLVYRFSDRWGAKFHEAVIGATVALNKQADAMADLAKNVTTAHDDARETLIVMRAMARTLDDTQQAVGETRLEVDRLRKEICERPTGA